MKNIILISGKAGVGKDTFALELKKQLEKKGNKVIIDRFAKYIKGYLKEYYGWDGESKDIYWREKLQQLGTEIIKENLNYKAFHAKRIAEDIQIIYDDFDYFLIPDCRFRDEVHMLLSMFPDDVITVRVSRKFKSVLTEEQKKHKSECDLDDFRFDNYLPLYHNKVDEAAKWFIKDNNLE